MQEFKPILQNGFSEQDDQITFFGREKKLTIIGLNKSIKLVISNCDGYTTAEEIITRLVLTGEEKETVEAILQTLQDIAVITDSRDSFIQFHKDTMNPMIFYRGLSPEQISDITLRVQEKRSYSRAIDLIEPTHSNSWNILKNRETIRDFTKEELSLEHLSGLCKMMMGTAKNKPHPSAGGLYPLKLYVSIPNGGKIVPSGVYEYDKDDECLGVFAEDFDYGLFARIFDGEEIVENAGAIFIITADIKRHTEKYSNRGYRYTLLEAGHSAQNAQIYCQENCLGCFEYGGFDEKYLKESFDFGKDEYPIISLVVGHPDRNPVKNVTDTVSEKFNLADTLKKRYIGENKIIKSLLTTNLSRGIIKSTLIGLVAEYGDPSNINLYREGSAFGTSFSYDEAVIKTIAEAIERYYCGVTNITHRGRITDFPNTIHPYNLMPLHPDANDYLNIENFDANKEYGWVSGTKIASMEEILVLPELVYFPTPEQEIGRMQVTEGCSNGASAHINKMKAIENGLLELIERDALMVTWFSKKEVSAIPKNILDVKLTQRFNKWEQEGFYIKFIDLTIDSVPVIMAIGYSDTQYPYFACGASAHFDINSAARKAFDELELQLLTWQKSTEPKVSPEEVKFPNHHGLLYAQENQGERVAWLLEAKEKISDFNEIGFKDLLKFDPMVFTLKEKEFENDLVVVKVLSEKLIPIHFGYGAEHYMHKRLLDSGYTWNESYPSFPHFFA